MPVRSSCLILLTLCAATMAQEASREAQEWWNSWPQLKGNAVFYDYLPDHARMDVQELYNRHKAMPQLALPQSAIDEYCQRYNVAKEDFNEDHKSVAAQMYRDWKFNQMNIGFTTALANAGFERRFRDMELPEKIDKSKGTYIVFVPFPCPSQKAYNESEQLMLKVCETAGTLGAKVIIVRSYYGITQSLDGLKESRQPWREEILNLPTVFKKHIEAGTVILQDGLKVNMRATPWMFIINEGRSEGGHHIQDVTSNPAPLLKKLEGFKRQAEIDQEMARLHPEARAASRAAQDWWNKWGYENLAGNYVPYFYLPKNLHDHVEKLYQRYLVIQKMDPPQEHYARYREANQLTEKQFDQKHLAKADTAYRYSKLTSENKDVILGLIYAGFDRRFQDLGLPEHAAKKGMHVVFVPFPCESREAYEKIEQVMVTACETSNKIGAKVIIVRGHFARAESVVTLAGPEDPWSKEIKELPEVFKKHVEAGSLEIKDGLRLAFPVAPWAFIVRDGKTLFCGNLNTWAANAKQFGPTLEQIGSQSTTP